MKATLRGFGLRDLLSAATEAMVAELPKKKEPMPAMPPGGGMDY